MTKPGMKTRVSTVLAVWLCLIAMRPTDGLAQIVWNGDFETPVVEPGDSNFILFSAGETFTGWTVDSGSVALTATYSFGQRQQFLFLGGAIHQDLATTPGADYLLSLMIGFGGDDIPPPLTISWGTNALQIHEQAALQTYSFNVTASEATTRLGFSSRNYNVLVDNVTVVPVPRLGITPLGGAQARMTWRTNFTDYVLEYATSLPARAWTPITNGITVAGDSASLTVDLKNEQLVFRLRKP